MVTFNQLKELGFDNLYSICINKNNKDWISIQYFKSSNTMRVYDSCKNKDTYIGDIKNKKQLEDIINTVKNLVG